ncbi:MAG: Rrf2 family transcriptional regulator [Deltaproteobacteria bacterium]|nr:Rrf2 family transcriptional regulator [Deltaproteobacteria bacterium]
MLKFSRKVDYGLILLSKLCAEPEASSAREMAARYRLPQPMVANILKALAGAGILDSTRGAQGGYELARRPEQISLADVVEALEGPFSLVECISGGPEQHGGGEGPPPGEKSACKFISLCPTHDPLHMVHRKFTEFMSGLTIDQISESRKAAPASGPPGS